MKDVITGQLFAASISNHVLPADNAHIIGVFNVLSGGIRIAGGGNDHK